MSLVVWIPLELVTPMEIGSSSTHSNGTGEYREYTDTVMQCQGQRGVIEIEFAHTGTFMFHAHQSEFTELGWMGFFNVVD